MIRLVESRHIEIFDRQYIAISLICKRYVKKCFRKTVKLGLLFIKCLFFYPTVSPRLNLAAGHNLNMNDIREGADAYFECNIRANPRVHRVDWSHNVSRIDPKVHRVDWSHNISNNRS